MTTVWSRIIALPDEALRLLLHFWFTCLRLLVFFFYNGRHLNARGFNCNGVTFCRRTHGYHSAIGNAQNICYCYARYFMLIILPWQGWHQGGTKNVWSSCFDQEYLRYSANLSLARNVTTRY
jgi:hypothetical protein